MYNPIATYRLQFHKDFTFRQLKDMLPYLEQLGIRTVYASPIFEATAGSTHGYDVTNPLRINPEIGTLQELESIHEQLQAKGMGWLQDIVPNHMAYVPGNHWLMEVLKKGKAAAYASFFDILWDKGEKLMAPFLGKPLEEVIAANELKVVPQENGWAIQYFDNQFPLKEGSTFALKTAADAEALNQNPARLKDLLDQQHYRLCHWLETDTHINYRRFFTVNGLICLNAQDPNALDQTHAFIFSLLERGIFNGLRIDHIDGLFDPQQYLTELRKRVGATTYIVVEKILERGEALPPWPIEGTTGYDFLALVNNLLTWQESEQDFTRFYEELTGNKLPLEEQLAEKKSYMLYQHMQGELDNLTDLYLNINTDYKNKKEAAKTAIGYFLVAMPVYRFYGNQLPLPQQEAAALNDIFEKIAVQNPVQQEAVQALRSTLLEKPLAGDEAFNRLALYFYQRLMQLSGPLMAKGMEDTLMYTYQRFRGHNDVGDSPENFGLAKSDFHQTMSERAVHWPLAMNGTATHDTKRGEGARALLNVLTAIPHQWFAAVREWRALNEDIRIDGVPTVNLEYGMYQTLFASWPLDPEEEADYPERFQAFLQKALREAKQHSDWASPNEEYEQQVRTFAERLLDKERPFWKSFLSFRETWQDFGMVNSLAQVVLKCCCPGVPDVYQGTELWDQSLVDPDNRRPVDFEKRAQLLDTIQDKSWTTLWSHRQDGRIKMKLLQELLLLRQKHAALFEKGSYLPLKVTGAHKDRLLAFARMHESNCLLVLIPLHLPASFSSVTGASWGDTRLQLPPSLLQAWAGRHQKEIGPYRDGIPVEEITGTLPIAFELLAVQEHPRAAGILAAITSLPTAFGIGDFGPAAHRFIQLLEESGQRYWQLLPLNPVSDASGFSPYSSVSTLAGNPLLISPDLLYREGLLRQEEIETCSLPITDKVNYPEVEKCKQQLLELAWQRYQQGGFEDLEKNVAAFCTREAWWLDDFALYVALKEKQDGRPWYEWPEPYRKRETFALAAFAAAQEEELSFIKFQQAVFYFQWQALRQCSRQSNIKLIGDLPFYASYDSADVWSHPQLFSIDEAGRLTGVAGVPPDYFSETGQLWGMPTFKWQEMEKDGYQWWILRLRKNLELYDLLRIDHFRALAAYWEVPADEVTAENGQWIKGPGAAFFEAIKKPLGGLPFIAEDLGDNMQDVYKLRDEVGLPGMKVLLFAFGDNLPTSIDAPHNYPHNCIVYSGTHDNNTALGWYRQDAAAADRKRLSDYVGCSVSENNIPEVMARLAYASVAKLAILPLQDVLGLDEQARMNMPGTASNNWAWRLTEIPAAASLEWLKEMAFLYGRSGRV